MGDFIDTMYNLKINAENYYRLLCHGFHISALLVLCYKFIKTHSSQGISGGSLILFATVYTVRFMDIFTNFISLYNTQLTITYIIVSYTFVYLVYFQFKQTYQREFDTFRIGYVLVFCLSLAAFFTYATDPIEVYLVCNIYLEDVAILPQMWFVYKAGIAEKYVMPYMTLLCLYRGFYILNWLYIYEFENQFGLISTVGGVVHVSIYIVFFAYWICCKEENMKGINYVSNLQNSVDEKLLNIGPFKERENDRIEPIFWISDERICDGSKLEQI